jgi:hypothetical protein
MSRRDGAPRELAPEVERQREQHERNQIAQDPRQHEQHAGEYFAPAVDQTAKQRLFAVHGGNRIGTERHALVAQQIGARDERHQQPSPYGHAGPAREAHRRVQIDEGETQYNHHQYEAHGNSLAGAAILILTQMPDRASAQSLARSLVEARLAACVSIGSPVESLYHWRGQTKQRRKFRLP